MQQQQQQQQLQAEEPLGAESQISVHQTVSKSRCSGSIADKEVRLQQIKLV